MRQLTIRSAVAVEEVDFMADKPYVNPFEDVHKKALAVRDRTRKIGEKEAGVRTKGEEREEPAEDERKPSP